MATVAPCKASSASAFSYWTMRIIRKSTGAVLNLPHRADLNIPVANVWDDENTAWFMTGFENDTYIVRFTNKMGVKTDTTYNSRVAIFCIPYR